MSIIYTRSNHEMIHLVKPLWEELRNHHASISSNFSDQILKYNFEDRSKHLMEKSEKGKLLIIFAVHESTGERIGYCINSIGMASKQGEVDSIYILDQYRGIGIGDTLMNMSLEWFKENNVQDINIVVLFGNNNALAFYEKYDFFPRTYSLRKIL